MLSDAPMPLKSFRVKNWYVMCPEDWLFCVQKTCLYVSRRLVCVCPEDNLCFFQEQRISETKEENEQIATS